MADLFLILEKFLFLSAIIAYNKILNYAIG